MANQVTLCFDSTLTRLAGYSYGKTIYETQVKGRLDLSKKAYLVFPQTIIKAASSFVQGFFENIIAEIGIDAIGDSLELICNNELKESIMKSL